MLARPPPVLMRHESVLRTHPMICPMHVSEGGYPVVPIMVQGVATTAIVDTGATTSVLNAKTASQLSLKAVGVSQTHGMISKTSHVLAQAPRLQVCGMDLALKVVLIADLDAMIWGTSDQPQVVLGQDFLSKGVVVLDFPKSELRISAARLNKVNYQPLARSSEGRLGFSVKVNGITCWATMDSGSAVPVYVSPRLFDIIKSGNSRLKISSTVTRGIEGVASARLFSLSELGIFGSNFYRVPAQSPEGWADSSDIVIGRPVLERFSISLDLSTLRVLFASDETVLHKEFARDRSGMNVERIQGGLRVVFVTPDGPANDAGIKAGDVIIRVDGQTVGPDLFRARPRMGAEEAGKLEQLTLSDGRVLKLVLRDYF